MNRMDNGSSCLMFMETPAEEICDYFGVGRFDYPPNRVEQGGWLVGRYMSRQPDCTQALVTHFLPATGCIGTPDYLDWPAMENIRLQRRFAALKEELEENDPGLARQICLLGWIHSHPNRLPVFLSTTDFENIRDHFNDPHQFSVVLNPHTRNCEAFLGPAGCKVPSALYRPLVRYFCDRPDAPVEPPDETVPARQKKQKKSVYGKPPKRKRRKRGRKKGR